MRIVLDIETRSDNNLLSSGAYRYARDPSTEILCLGYKINLNPSRLIVFNWGKDGPEAVLEAEPSLRQRLGTLEELKAATDAPEAVVVAHNIEFEHEVMLPRLPNLNVAGWNWSDTMARGRAIGLPGSLKNMATVLMQTHKKNPKGHTTMLQCCKPRPAWKKNGTGGKWFEDAARFGVNFDYCLDDVEAEAEVDRSVPELTDLEHERWWRVIRQNRLGLPIDVGFVKAAVAMLREDERDLLSEMPALTDGLVRSPKQVAETISWMGVHGVFVDDLQARTVARTLETYQGMDTRVRRVLEIRQQVSKSSVKKFEAALNSVCDDGSVKGTVIYHGAHTGRPTGSGFQPLNLIKPEKGYDHDEIIPVVTRGDVAGVRAYGPIQTAIASCLRGSIRARPGKIFRVADFASIEARGVLWLAGDERALEIFRGGGDIYCDLAEDIYGYPCTKENNPEERDIGKRGVLGCGYQIGPPKLKQNLKDQFDIDISKELSEKIVSAYRFKYDAVPVLWRAYGAAAERAIGDPRGLYETHRCYFYFDAGWLQITLPSGRRLHYPHAGIERRTKSWGEVDQIVYTSQFMGKIVRKETYGGKLTENICQAMCRDIMLEGEARLEAAGYNPLMNIYDETVCECPIEHGSVAEVEELLAAPPAWCSDMPISAEGYETYRYRKG